MAVMSCHVNVAFELAPEKKEQFMKINNGKSGATQAIERASKFTPHSMLCAVRKDK